LGKVFIQKDQNLPQNGFFADCRQVFGCLFRIFDRPLFGQIFGRPLFGKIFARPLFGKIFGRLFFGCRIFGRPLFGQIFGRLDCRSFTSAELPRSCIFIAPHLILPNALRVCHGRFYSSPFPNAKQGRDSLIFKNYA
jgi:hypothetical protein